MLRKNGFVTFEDSISKETVISGKFTLSADGKQISKSMKKKYLRSEIQIAGEGQKA